MRAVALLSWWQLRNSLRSLFTDPRKLVPAIILLVVLVPTIVGISFMPYFMASVKTSAPLASHSSLVGPVLRAALMLLTLLALAANESAMAFAAGDVDYLFPSPIARRVVLAYKLPKLLLAAFGFALAIFIYFRILGGMADPGLVGAASAWRCLLALSLYQFMVSNVALAVSIRMIDMKWFRRTLLLIAAVLAGLLGINALNGGPVGFTAAADHPVLDYAFWPASLASNVLAPTTSTVSLGLDPFALLALLALLSLVPLFATEANFYEQAIAVTTRMVAFRAAAKGGGWSGIMAVRAAKFKYRSSRTYTVPAFGQGAWALFWAHLCAAAKRPWANLVFPVLAGVAAGALAGCSVVFTGKAAYMVDILVPIYAGMLFLGIAKTAAESSIRRRDLVSPLPLRGSQVVLADLGVPLTISWLFGLLAGASYAVTGAPFGAQAFVIMAIWFPLETGTRMVMQYIVVLANPDISDKVQQMFSGCAVNLLSFPLLFIEGCLCLPAFFLGSVWGVIVTLIVVDGGLMALLTMAAGRAAEKAIATGEPVRLTDIFRKRNVGWQT